MRKAMFTVWLLAIALIVGVGYSARACPEKKAIHDEAATTTESQDVAKEEAKDELKSICPKTRMDDKCFYCHVAPTFALKEVDPHAIYDYPFIGQASKFFFMFDEKQIPVKGYFVLTDVDASDLQKVMNYCDRHGVKYLVVELFTPGGSLFDAYKLVGLMRHWKSQGKTIETRTYGFAASAGFLVFASGTKGLRFVSPQAELMWHELQALEIFNITSPSDKEDEARVLRHLQNTANAWLAEASGKTKEEVDALVHKKEYWINGQEAVEAGFADGLLINLSEADPHVYGYPFFG